MYGGQQLLFRQLAVAIVATLAPVLACLQLSKPAPCCPFSRLQVHPIPLSDIKAVHKHTPPLGYHRITLTLTNGVSLPSLYFQIVSGAGCWLADRQHSLC